MPWVVAAYGRKRSLRFFLIQINNDRHLYQKSFASCQCPTDPTREVAKESKSEPQYYLCRGPDLVVAAADRVPGLRPDLSRVSNKDAIGASWNCFGRYGDERLAPGPVQLDRRPALRTGRRIRGIWAGPRRMSVSDPCLGPTLASPRLRRPGHLIPHTDCRRTHQTAVHLGPCSVGERDSLLHAESLARLSPRMDAGFT